MTRSNSEYNNQNQNNSKSLNSYYNNKHKNPPHIHYITIKQQYQKMR